MGKRERISIMETKKLKNNQRRNRQNEKITLKIQQKYGK